LKLKFRTVAEKTAKNFRGLLYFAAPGRLNPQKLRNLACHWSMVLVPGMYVMGLSL